MEELVATLEAYNSSWVSTLVSFLSSGLWAYLYYRLRAKVRTREIRRGAIMEQAAEDVNNPKSNKEQKAYSMGILRGLAEMPNIIIKGGDDERKDPKN